MAKRQVFTCIAFLVLLAVRILVVDPVSNIEQAIGISNPPFITEFLITIRDAASYLLISWCFLLVGIIVIVNRGELQSLNIDGSFIILFVFCSLSYLYYFPWPTGWITLLVPIILFILSRKRNSKFVAMEPIVARSILIVLITFALIFMFMLVPLSTIKILEINRNLLYGAPFVLMEEIIFRGLLWRFLTNLSLSASKILALQAFLFWFSHVNNMIADPVFFWLLVPLIGLILGLIVWRSKSLTVSFVAHILLNFFIESSLKITELLSCSL